MTDKLFANRSNRIYRVDKFIVPIQSRDEFVAKVQTTHDLLRTQPGFVQDFVLEKAAGPGEFNFVTIVEWENAQSVENARSAVSAMHQAIQFNPKETLARLGITADIANYMHMEV